MSTDPMAALEAHFESIDLRTSDRLDRDLEIRLNEALRAPAISVDLRSLRPLSALLLAPSIVAGWMGFTRSIDTRDEIVEFESFVAELLAPRGE